MAIFDRFVSGLCNAERKTRVVACDLAKKKKK